MNTIMNIIGSMSYLTNLSFGQEIKTFRIKNQIKLHQLI